MKKIRAVRAEPNAKELMTAFVLYNSVLLAVTVVYAVAFVTLGDTGIFRCAFLSRFGFYCPGCGGSRSLIALLSFDFVSSFIYYPPLILSLWLIIFADAVTLLSLVTKNMKYAKLFRREYFIFLPAVIFLSYAVRLILLLFGIDPIGDAWAIR